MRFIVMSVFINGNNRADAPGIHHLSQSMISLGTGRRLRGDHELGHRGPRCHDGEPDDGRWDSRKERDAACATHEGLPTAHQ